MGIAYSQVFPPAAPLTEHNLPSQVGKVFIVTGGYSGVGQQLTSILYHAGGTVYIAGRSKEKAEHAIAEIKQQPATTHSSNGKLHFLSVDLSDLVTIKPAITHFAASETKCDVLFNNAGVSWTAADARSSQGYEMILATNCLGPLLLTDLLLPYLQAAASTSSPGSTRVVWSSSQMTDFCPKGGFEMSAIKTPPTDPNERYTNSKTGNWFLATEYARHTAISNRILSITQNPGALRTGILRNASKIMQTIVLPLLHKPIYGAYTELFCGVSPELNLEEHSGAYILPWGRVHPSPRGDLLAATKSKDDGGTGLAEEFYGWCEEQIAKYK